MNGRVEIDPKDIRAGDLIRWERLGDSTPRAIEYVASTDGVAWSSARGKHYLLDRPSPTVELPTEPTLGWVDFKHTVPGYLGVWRDGGEDVVGTLLDGYSSDCWQRKYITAFTPATAVPTDALDSLREHGETRALEFSKAAIRDFLAAVDRAGSLDGGA